MSNKLKVITIRIRIACGKDFASSDLREIQKLKKWFIANTMVLETFLLHYVMLFERLPSGS